VRKNIDAHHGRKNSKPQAPDCIIRHYKRSLKIWKTHYQRLTTFKVSIFSKIRQFSQLFKKLGLIGAQGLGGFLGVRDGKNFPACILKSAGCGFSKKATAHEKQPTHVPERFAQLGLN
jgi:hypothetical protein